MAMGIPRFTTLLLRAQEAGPMAILAKKAVAVVAASFLQLHLRWFQVTDTPLKLRV
jgi:hypothetical protein